MQDEMGNLMHHDQQELLSLWEGWHWDDNQGAWVALTRSCAPRQDVKKWSTSVVARCTRVSPEKCAYVRRGRFPIKTGWAETDKGQPGKPNVRARWVAKVHKSHARPELYASTPPQEATKAVQSEIATDKRGGTLVALVDVSTKKSICRTAARRLPGRWTSTSAGCCNTACTARATPRKNWHRRSAVSK